MKSVKVYKKIIALVLILVMSINSFAAVVADNDGSAFITKAEFDSLKNNFQSQLDSYNSAIDNKIDTAIAGYLAGITVEQEMDLESLLYKNNEYKVVEFSNTWTPPTTTIGDKCTVASLFWSIWNFNVYVNSLGYYTVYECGWMNSTKDNSSTFITDTKGTTQTEICQPGYNEQYAKYYMDNGSFWKVTPYAYALAFRWHSNLPDSWVNESNCQNVSMSLSGDTGTWQLSSGSAFGAVTKSFNISFSGLNNPSTTETMSGTYLTGTKDEAITLSTLTGNKYIYRLAGNLVNGTIKTTKVNDWNTVENSACYTFNLNNNSGYRLGNYWVGSYVGYNQYTLNNWPANLPQMNVYNKKNTNMNASDLIIDGYTNVSGMPIYYYSGIPIFKATTDGIAELELKFDVDVTTTGLSNGAKYSIKDTSFSNNNSLDAPTEKFYTDKDLKTEYSTLQFTGNSHTKTLYFKAKAGKTYWIKVKPDTANDVKVNTANDSVKMIIGKLD